MFIRFVLNETPSAEASFEKRIPRTSEPNCGLHRMLLDGLRSRLPLLVFVAVLVILFRRYLRGRSPLRKAGLRLH